MNEQDVKRYTLYTMGVIGVLLLVWAVFGNRGDVRNEFRPVDAPYFSALEVNEMEFDESEVDDVASELTSEASKSATVKKSAPVAANEKLADGGRSEIMRLLSTNDTIRALNRYEAHFDSMPPGGIKMRIASLGGSLGRVFNDSNYLHINSAEQIGVRPLQSLRDAWQAGTNLERLRSCEEYYLDNLTHSLPYLVPKAHRLLTDIGAAFRDSLRSRGGGDYRIKVTSVLRTPRLVKRLRRRNRNAVETSAHLFGTTFDISYAKFICDSTGTPRTQEDMKNLLGEVVFAMREQGRCYVKYERKQACFHITAR